MEKLTKESLKAHLTKRLRLLDAEFRLRKAGSRWVGNIISVSFKGKRDHERQEMILNGLAAEFGEEAVRLVGLLLAYTPDECNLGAKAKKAG